MRRPAAALKMQVVSAITVSLTWSWASTRQGEICSSLLSRLQQPADAATGDHQAGGGADETAETLQQHIAGPQPRRSSGAPPPSSTWPTAATAESKPGLKSGQFGGAGMAKATNTSNSWAANHHPAARMANRTHSQSKNVFSLFYFQ
jgi:hypothetical protein